MAAHERTLAEVAYRALEWHLRAMLRHEPGVRRGADPEELHDMRVAIRHVRAALRVFRDALPPRRADAFRKEFRWLAGALGTVRDLDVYLLQLEKDIRRIPDEHSAGLEAVQGRLLHEREISRGRMLRCLDSKRRGRLVAGFEKFVAAAVAGSAGNVPALEAARNLVRKQFVRVLRAGALALCDPEDVRLHRLRIQSKRLRYTCQFFQHFYGRPVAAFARRIGRLQGLLGAHHDSVVALQHLERLSRGASSPAKLAAVKGGVERLRVIQRRRRERLRRAFQREWPEFTRRKMRREFERALKIRIRRP